MDLIEFNGIKYPAFQAQGNASQFSKPYALHFCKGFGVDIGYNRHEWRLPGAIGVDKEKTYPFHASDFPYENLDYIYSSHCLEHITDWVDTMNYWYDKLRIGGILFLYLPDYSQEYWRPWNNRKHVNIFTPEIMKDFLKQKNYKNIFISGIDLNNSFMAVGEK